jgi:RNA polymerase sigma-54 factor
LKTTLSQGQRTEQTQAMTQAMRMSLTLLHLGPEDLAEAAVAEARRNPFLRIAPPLLQSGSRPGPGDRPSLDETLAAEQTDAALLEAQIGTIALPPHEMRLARQLVHCLDERGFLADPIAEMSGYLDTDPDLLSRVIEKLQGRIEPVGVFAWSLADCFRIQLQAKNRCDPIILKLLARLDLVAQKDVEAICTLCSVDRDDAVDMLADIRALCPSPLIPSATVAVAAQEPELIFVPAPDGNTKVELNPAAFPAILADDGLFDRMRQVELDPAALRYYRDCYRGAAAFVIATQKRANTLLLMGHQIALAQQKFLQTGRSLDRSPLTTATLAQALGLNKSTVSRAMNNCRIATPGGVLAAKEFLVRPISGTTERRTRDQALHRLSVLIRAEDRRQPYSDDLLAQLLGKANLAISRRTVAKYRGLLGVPGMNERRQGKPGRFDLA